jgi:hypothetical protein
MMDPKQEALKCALKKMFSDSHFNICSIDKLLTLTNTIKDKELYNILSSIHCVSWDSMTPEFRDWVFLKVVTMFNGNGFNLSEVDFKDFNNSPALPLIHFNNSLI